MNLASLRFATFILLLIVIIAILTVTYLDKSQQENTQQESPPSTLPTLIRDVVPKPETKAKFDKITDGLYLGPHDVTAEQLRDVGVTHVIRLLPRDFHGGDTFGYDIFDWPKQTELVTYINDSPKEKIMPSVKLYVKRIKDIIKDGGVVYVHCMAGISRSSSVVVGYIMNKYRMKAEDAVGFVRERRSCVNPNIGFMAELKGSGPQIWLIT